ncbi:MAG: cytochrome c oxidase subunit II, partial [Acidobacteriaceae bacterium]|nr:cytochrome c oxidase subunit II [Acidobacteriaceae bacterium]
AAIPLFPPVASEQASQIDALYFFISGVTIVMTGLIFAGVIFFAYKYRRSAHPKPTQIEGSTKLELFWSIAPFIVMLFMFAWGAQLYYAAQNPPKDAMEIFVTGKQWMWKIQYPNGGREIDELHVPVGQPVKLTMASEDVIHSFSIPAFRVRHDVMPGHYNSLWFTASKPGDYRLFCTEYCGLWHSKMGGWVHVMGQREYANWASGGGAQGTLAEQGEKLFQQYGCSTCHLLDQQGRCPNLRGLYNKPVQLNNGQTVLADDAYIRESILDPNAKIVAGFEPNVMPNFKGQISEENVIQLIAFVKSLAPNAPASQVGPGQRPIVAGAPAPKSTNVGRAAKTATGNR